MYTNTFEVKRDNYEIDSSIYNMLHEQLEILIATN